MSFARLFEFELALAEYTGAPYVVVTDCCTHAIELCMRYDRVTQCAFTAFTYLSIPQLIRRLNIDYILLPLPDWQGEYKFLGTRIWDSARRLEHRMYRPGEMQCLSFGYSKPLQLGRCGAILLDDVDAYHTMSRWRSDGRDLSVSPWQNQRVFGPGYHYCPTLEICERGLNLLPLTRPQIQTVQYPDCRNIDLR